ncbi:MAG: hypothetical protein IPM38_14060 [Ignavibacteria bacterium]|nr:hypothetical protein [Ignavibacteria bacterium]
MKKFTFTFSILLLTYFFVGNSFSQSYKLEKINQTDISKILNPFDAVSVNPIQLDGPNPPSIQAAIITPIGSGGGSTFGRAPQASTRYQRCYYFISAEEMQNSGYPVGQNITSLGFNYSAQTNGATADTFKVYFENGAATFIDKGSNWTTAISTMTQVHQGVMTIPSSPGTVDYTLNNPGAFTYTGSGLWIAFEYQNITGLLGAVNTAICNTALGSTLRNMSSGSNVALSNTMSSFSAFRPETRLGTSLDDIVSVGNVYAMGEKLSGCIDTNYFANYFEHLRSGIDSIYFKYVIKNEAGNTVKDSVTVLVILNDTASVTGYILTLPFLKSDEIKADSIIVTATTTANEGLIGNNTGKTRTEATLNTINQAITASNNTGGAGFNGGAGFEIGIAHTSGDCPIYLNSLNYIFGSTGQTYQISVYAGDSGNTPGTLLYNSGNLVNVTGANSHTLPSPLFLTAGKFFVAFKQVGTTNFSLQFQQEIPIRSDVYYTGNPGSWSPSFGGFKYNVQLVTTTNLDLTLLMEGFFNGTTMVGDTVNVNLREQTPPYNIVDNATAYVNSSGNGVFNFTNASANTCYYYEVIHRNHIRTFSHSTCEEFTANTTSYDFSSASSQALGNNLVFVSADNVGPGGWATYTSDVNQDDVVDLTDCSDIDNDAFNFLSGYVVTDVNGDEVVDLTDLSFCDNNAANFVSAITP